MCTLTNGPMEVIPYKYSCLRCVSDNTHSHTHTHTHTDRLERTWENASVGVFSIFLTSWGVNALKQHRRPVLVATAAPSRFTQHPTPKTIKRKTDTAPRREERANRCLCVCVCVCTGVVCVWWERAGVCRCGIPCMRTHEGTSASPGVCFSSSLCEKTTCYDYDLNGGYSPPGGSNAKKMKIKRLVQFLSPTPTFIGSPYMAVNIHTRCENGCKSGRGAKRENTSTPWEWRAVWHSFQSLKWGGNY